MGIFKRLLRRQRANATASSPETESVEKTPEQLRQEGYELGRQAGRDALRRKRRGL